MRQQGVDAIDAITTCKIARSNGRQTCRPLEESRGQVQLQVYGCRFIASPELTHVLRSNSVLFTIAWRIGNAINKANV